MDQRSKLNPPNHGGFFVTVLKWQIIMGPDQRLGTYSLMSPLERNLELRTLFDLLPALTPIYSGIWADMDLIDVAKKLDTQLKRRSTSEPAGVMVGRMQTLTGYSRMTVSGQQFLIAEYNIYQRFGIDKGARQVDDRQSRPNLDIYKQVMQWNEPIGMGPFEDSSAKTVELEIYKSEAARIMRKHLAFSFLEDMLRDAEARELLEHAPTISGEMYYPSDSDKDFEVSLILLPGTTLPGNYEGLKDLALRDQQQHQILRAWRQDIIQHWGEEP